jgi:hypothetical protein
MQDSAAASRVEVVNQLELIAELELLVRTPHLFSPPLPIRHR